ncbi:hypothetical protein BBP40_008946 [Aspergillus hancockii]|nr:hypothetical protein BBP40_008946 [Aspergillus hancockii]
MPEVPEEFIDVAIVGAGWYGLKTAKTYLDLEPNTKLAVFDGDNTVGGVWSKDRIYPNLVVQAGLGYFSYPDIPMSIEGESGNHLVSAQMIHGYLEKFAIDSGLMRSFDSTVGSIRSNEAPGVGG